MGRTMAEKILARHSDTPDARAGDLLILRLDLVHVHDANGHLAFQTFERFGATRVFDPERVVLISDHFAPAKDVQSAHAPIALKGAGISCVVARSFARIFFRNAINIGLPVIIAPAAVDAITEGQSITVDLRQGRIQADSQVFEAQPLPPFIQDLINAGGLEQFVRQRLAARQR